VPSRLICTALLSATIFLLGCGRGTTPEGMPKQTTVPVSGLVRYSGKGVADASLTFQSLDGKIISRASTDKAGIFSATSTYGKDDGTPPGKYKVMVAVSPVTEIAPGVLAPEPPGGFKSPIPTKYANLATTDIVVDVKEQGKNELLIDLK